MHFLLTYLIYRIWTRLLSHVIASIGNPMLQKIYIYIKRYRYITKPKN